MNRYTSISTGSFKPLDLQTIMMIPMAKQKQHDEAQAYANEYASLQASSLEQDREAVTNKLEGLRGQANAITETLLDRGIDRNTMAKLNELKRAKEKEFGQQGLIGNAQANYATASAFIKDLTEKKERQAGWSPAEAKKWAQHQVAQFKGTDIGEGKFGSFSGRELENYVDTNKWINDNIAKVAADTDPIMMQKYGSVGAFETAWKSGTVEHKDAAKIIKALSLQAQYDHKLQASLKQSAAFSGEKDPTNIGEYQIVKKNGVSREVFVPKSMFGMQLLGAASGAAYRKEDAKYNMVTDHVGIDLMKRKLDKEDANDMIVTVNGGLMGIPPVKYENLKATVSMAKDQASVVAGQLRQRIATFKADPKNAGIDPNSNAEIKQLKQENNDAMIKYNNAFQNLDALHKKANVGMNNIDKRRAVEGASIDTKVSKIIDNMPSLGQSIRGVFTGESPRQDYLMREFTKLGMSKRQAAMTASNMVGVPESVQRDEIKKQTMLVRGLLSPKDASNPYEVTKSYNTYLHTTRKYEQKAQAYLKDNPSSFDYEVLDGTAEGKYSTSVGVATKLLSESFNSLGGEGWTDANTGEDLNKFMAENPGAKFVVLPTTGQSLKGDPIEVLVAQDKDGVRLGSRAVTRGEHGFKFQQQIGHDLAAGGIHRQMGEKLIRDTKYGRDVKGLGIHESSFSGKVVPNQEAPDGSLIYIQKNSAEKYGSESFTVFKINKDAYLRSKGNDIKVIGHGSPALGTDNVIQIVNDIKGGN
jgi:hypothetical protein